MIQQLFLYMCVKLMEKITCWELIVCKVCWLFELYRCVKHQTSKCEAERRFEHCIKFFNLDASKKGLRRAYTNVSFQYL